MGIFSIGYSALTLLWMGVVVVHTFFNLGAAEWASWVQAIGSIGAIIGAYLIARIQQKGADATRRQEAIVKLTQLSGLCAEIAEEAAQAINAVTRIYDRHVGPQAMRHPDTRLQNAHALIVIALKKDIPAEIAYAMIRLQRLLDITIRSLGQRQGMTAPVSPATLRLAQNRSIQSRAWQVSIVEYAEQIRAGADIA